MTGGSSAHDSPAITFVVPAHNVGAYVSRTVVSLLEQTVHDHEVIVINDGSTDGTAEILEGLQQGAGAVAMTVIHQENAGGSAARNAGLERARGRYCIFLDGDDWVAPTLVASLAPAVAQGIDLIHWRFTYLDERGEPDSTFDNWSTTWPADPWVMLGGLLRNDLRWLWIGATCWRTDFLQHHHHRFAVGCATGEDSEFLWTALIRAQSAVYIDQALTVYLKRVSSVSQTLDVRRLDAAAAYLRVVAQLRREDREGAATMVDSLVKLAVNRYLWTIDELARDRPVRELLRAVSRRVPGLPRAIRRELAQSSGTGAQLGVRRQLVRVVPWSELFLPKIEAWRPAGRS